MENVKALDSRFALVWGSSVVRVHDLTHGIQTQEPSASCASA